MTADELIAQVYAAKTHEDAYLVVRQAYDAATAKTMTVQEYNSVYIAYDRRREGRTEWGSDCWRGGPRVGNNWSGD